MLMPREQQQGQQRLRLHSKAVTKKPTARSQTLIASTPSTLRIAHRRAVIVVLAGRVADPEAEALDVVVVDVVPVADPAEDDSSRW